MAGAGVFQPDLMIYLNMSQLDISFFIHKKPYQSVQNRVIHFKYPHSHRPSTPYTVIISSAPILHKPLPTPTTPVHFAAIESSLIKSIFFKVLHKESTFKKQQKQYNPASNPRRHRVRGFFHKENSSPFSPPQNQSVLSAGCCFFLFL